MKTRTALLAATVMSFVAVSEARANPNLANFMNRCTPGALRACVSLQVVTVPIFSGGTTVTIRVQNTQGWVGWLGDNSGGSMLRKIGIVVPNITLNSGLTIVNNGGTAVGSPASLWSIVAPGGIGGPIELHATVGSGPHNYGGGIRGCGTPVPTVSQWYSTCGGGWIELSFTTVETWQAQNVELAWIIDPNNSLSMECGSEPSATRYDCAQVTPEPITMALLGSGIAGLGGFGVVRRRKKDNDVTNS